MSAEKSSLHYWHARYQHAQSSDRFQARLLPACRNPGAGTLREAGIADSKAIEVSENHKNAPEDKGLPLGQLALAAANTGQQDFLEKIPAALVKEMRDALSAEKAEALFDQTISFLEPSAFKNTAVFETLEQARLANQPDIVKLIFNKLSLGQFDQENRGSSAALELSTQDKDAAQR